jgi:hypothetical protein
MSEAISGNISDAAPDVATLIRATGPLRRKDQATFMTGQTIVVDGGVATAAV